MTARMIVSICLPLALAWTGCSDGEPVELPGTSSVQNPAGWRYERGIAFVARMGMEPIAVPFGFATSARGEIHEREARAWLARGETWDPFIDTRSTSSASPGVWRVLPERDLRVGAGPTGDVEWLGFQSGDRRLRLQLGAGPSGWYGGERERFRIIEGTLTLGSESIPGHVVEEMQVRRDGGRAAPGAVSDRIILLDDRGVALYLLHERGANPAAEGAEASWVHVGGREQATEEGAVDWLQVRTLEEGRREIPLHWSFSAPESGVSGEITAIGYHVMLGEERGGRREVEVRYTVEGWLERGGERVEVVGVVRHQQR